MKKRKKSIIPKNFPCKCGHIKRFHVEMGPPINDTYCDGDSGRVFDDGFLKGNPIPCDCFNYIPDNIKYLEMKYKANKRGKR